MKFAVTVGLKGSGHLSVQAQKWAAALGAPYILRPHKGTLQELLVAEELDALLIATAVGPQIFSREGRLFFHPGMAVLRLQRLEAGSTDHFVQALGLRAGTRVLDCTLGLGSDAIVAAHVCGSQGQVVGLEASKPLWFTVTQGLQAYKAEDANVNTAMRRIKTVNTLALTYLLMQPNDSFDVVYFDPMFKLPVKASSNMQPLRPVACELPLTTEVLTEALRIAPLVVVKETSRQVFTALGITKVLGGRYSKIKYGIMRR
ncbi:MAG: class I SAM-dependent methyltransferase [Acidaminococcaceae bacterium]